MITFIKLIKSRPTQNRSLVFKYKWRHAYIGKRGLNFCINAYVKQANYCFRGWGKRVRKPSNMRKVINGWPLNAFSKITEFSLFNICMKIHHLRKNNHIVKSCINFIKCKFFINIYQPDTCANQIWWSCIFWYKSPIWKVLKYLIFFINSILSGLNKPCFNGLCYCYKKRNK